MTTAYYSTVLNHPLETVWTLIRNFNNYPAYIEGGRIRSRERWAAVPREE